jgi:hypothetical protein
MVSYKARDGTMRTISREELARRVRDQDDMPRPDKDGKLSKSQEGSGTMDEVREWVGEGGGG